MVISRSPRDLERMTISVELMLLDARGLPMGRELLWASELTRAHRAWRGSAHVM